MRRTGDLVKAANPRWVQTTSNWSYWRSMCEAYAQQRTSYGWYDADETEYLKTLLISQMKRVRLEVVLCTRSGAACIVLSIVGCQVPAARRGSRPRNEQKKWSPRSRGRLIYYGRDEWAFVFKFEKAILAVSYKTTEIPLLQMKVKNYEYRTLVKISKNGLNLHILFDANYVQSKKLNK